MKIAAAGRWAEAGVWFDRNLRDAQHVPAG